MMRKLGGMRDHDENVCSAIHVSMKEGNAFSSHSVPSFYDDDDYCLHRAFKL